MSVEELSRQAASSELVSFGLKVPGDKLADLRLLATNDDRAVGYMIREAIVVYLAGRKEELEKLKRELNITPEPIPDPNPSVRKSGKNAA